MLGLIAVGCTSLFETIALFAGSHWSLYDEETMSLASAIDGALDTLPGEYYAVIRKIIESYFPWLTLSIVASKIIIPRIEDTIRLKREQRTNARERNITPENETVHRESATNSGFVNGTAYRTQSSFR